MSRDIRQTILPRIDPEQVSVAIDVESLSTASDFSCMFLPFPPITSLDDKKNTNQQKEGNPKKGLDEFASPAPRPLHGTASSSAPNSSWHQLLIIKQMMRYHPLLITKKMMIKKKVSTKKSPRM